MTHSTSEAKNHQCFQGKALSAALLLLVSGRSLPTLLQRTAHLLNQTLDANKLGSLSSLACSFNREPGELGCWLELVLQPRVRTPDLCRFVLLD